MSADFFERKYQAFGIRPPVLHVVLGSGLGLAFEELELDPEFELAGSFRLTEIPEVKGATAPGHAGLLRYYRHQKSGASLCFQAGRLHGYEGLDPSRVASPLVSARLAGTDNFLLTNASGGLRREYGPGSLMIINDHVNFTGKNPLVGPNPVGPTGAPVGPRFPDMSEVYDAALNAQLRAQLERAALKVYDGVYVGVLGPSYETHAEVRLYSNWGLGAVGMSTVWEAIALKHCGARVAGLSVISNLGAGLLPEKLNHEDVEREVRKVSKPLVAALFAFGKLHAGI